MRACAEVRARARTNRRRREATGPASGNRPSYAGITFRSRVHARWAAFFDVLEWPWEYERARLHGYTPTFVLGFHRAPIAVDVAPRSSACELRTRAARIAASGWPADFIIVGSRLVAPALVPGASLGTYYQRLEAPPGDVRAAEAGCAVVQTCLLCGRRSFFHELGTWKCAVCGRHDGNGGLGLQDAAEVRAWWRAAGRWVASREDG
jgi:hypothetical protein